MGTLHVLWRKKPTRCTGIRWNLQQSNNLGETDAIARLGGRMQPPIMSLENSHEELRISLRMPISSGCDCRNNTRKELPSLVAT